MTKAPERIWAFPKKDWFNAGASTHKITVSGAKDVEYVRADLLEAARNDALREAAEICNRPFRQSARNDILALIEGEKA